MVVRRVSLNISQHVAPAHIAFMSACIKLQQIQTDSVVSAHMLYLLRLCKEGQVVNMCALSVCLPVFVDSQHSRSSWNVLCEYAVLEHSERLHLQRQQVCDPSHA